MSWMNKELKKFGSVGRGVKVSTGAVIYGMENVFIGDNTRIDTGVIILSAAPGAYLAIGSHVHIASGAILMAAGRIELGNFATVGMHSTLVSASDDFTGDFLVGPVFDEDGFTKVTRAPIVLQDHAIVTTQCSLLPGALMLEGSVLGAMSLLKGKASPWTIYAGVPAKPIRERSMKALELGLQWQEIFAEKLRRGLV